MCLPVSGPKSFGIYEPQGHAIISLDVDAAPVLEANARSVALLCGARTGITLQFVADQSKTEAAYHRPDTLIWRDAGALVATLSLTAEAFGATATPLGRIGEELLALAQLGLPQMRAVGAVHFTGALD